MINIFYGYSIIWIIILLGYYLQWSDLCIPLDLRLLIFLVTSIIISFLIGYLFKKKLKFISLKENPHKKSTITVILIITYILEFLYARNIPLMSILVGGMSYLENNFEGIPIFHNFISSFTLFYSMYLSYIFFSFKDKKILKEIILVNLFFVLLMQRQNIIISFLFFLNIGLACNIHKITNKKKIIKIIFIFIILGIICLYIFGVLGNIRYGNNWSWNDSSMITQLGRMNDNYPKILPKEFFWSYTYLITPLVNLNYNISNYDSIDDIRLLVKEFLPDFVSSRVFDNNAKYTVNLPVSTLNASTAYVRAYLTYGIFGMYLMFFAQMLLCIFILNYAFKFNKEKFIVICNACAYFLFFTFFVNTFTYSITALLIIWSIFYCRKIKLKEIN